MNVPTSAVFHLIFLAITYQVCWTSNGPEQDVKEAIFAQYDKAIRPVRDGYSAVNVRLNPALFSFISINVGEQTITLKQWFRMKWTDEFLTWNPAAFNNVTYIMVSRADVWLPDIMILEQTELTQLDNDQYFVKLSSDGFIESSVDQVLTIHCEFDVSDFPYDTQNCTMRYTSWMYDAYHINPFPTNPTDMTAYSEHDDSSIHFKKFGLDSQILREWTMRNITSRVQTILGDGLEFVDVTYSIKITRKPFYYIMNFVLPSFVITCMAIIGVFTPYDEAGQRAEKVTLGLTALLTMAVILMLVTAEMPKTSHGVPLLGIFIMIEILLIALATLCAVLNLHLHKRYKNGKPPPDCLWALTCKSGNGNRKIFTKDAGGEQIETQNERNYTAQKAIDDAGLNVNVNDIKGEIVHEQWRQATQRLDILLMIIFLILNCIATAVILLIGQLKLNK